MPRSRQPGRDAVGPVRLRDELRRTLAALEAELDRDLARPAPSPEEVHRLHQELRRLSSGLAVWARLLSARSRLEAEEVVRRLRRLARLVGRVRDRDITVRLLTANPGGVPSGNPEWARFIGRLRDDSRTGRELLQAFLRTERRGGLLARAGRLLERRPVAESLTALTEVLGQERRRREGRVDRAHRRARKRPNVERLHRLRIRIRQWRHFAGLAHAVRPLPDRRPAVSWQRLQTQLGVLHDLDVALATVPETLVRAVPAGRLRRRRRHLLGSVRASLDRLSPTPSAVVVRRPKSLP